MIVNAAPGRTTRPTVLALHGGMGSADVMRTTSGFDDVARAHGFMVVYAEGTNFGGGRHAWNTGFLLRRQVQDADDLAYLDKLIDTLIRDYAADPTRIYMTGGSNGGMMTFVYAVARPERLAAIAPVVASMFTFEKVPQRPVPILIINGAQDEEVPLEGGMSRNPLVRRAQECAVQAAAGRGAVLGPREQIAGGAQGRHRGHGDHDDLRGRARRGRDRVRRGLGGWARLARLACPPRG